MNKQTDRFLIIGLVIFSLMLSSCASPARQNRGPSGSMVTSPAVSPIPSPSASPVPSPTVDSLPTLVFENNQCNYSGPSSLPTDFTLTWKINDSGSSTYAYVVLTLREGKTLQDLQDSLSLSSDQPEFTNLISRDYSNLGNLILKKEHNLAANGLYHGEPIYIVCFFDNETEAIGPIMIK